MRNIKLVIQYDGTSYCGWQVQVKSPSIQEEIEIKLHKILQEPIKLIGSGRTDSGVHAIGQVANFKSNCKLTCEQLFMALNSNLPKDIRIMTCEEVPLDFHARFSAKKREYKYVIFNDIVCPPFIRQYVYFIQKPIQYEKMKASLQYLMGEHDFRSLCSVKDDSKSKIRTIYDIETQKKNKELIIFIRANAFLRKMVRMIIGLAIEVSLKDLPNDEVLRILELKNRNAHGYPAAPSAGLFLNKVWYENDLNET